jgi:hypothetical protein
MRGFDMRFAVLAGFAAASIAFSSGSASAQAHDSHAQPALPETLRGWAKGARLYAGLGNYHRKITTRSALAQRYFDQGMRFVWAFNPIVCQGGRDRSILCELFLGRRSDYRPELQHADDELGSRPGRVGSRQEGRSICFACGAG